MGRMWPVPWAHIVTCLTPPVDRHWAAWDGFLYLEQITCFRASLTISSCKGCYNFSKMTETRKSTWKNVDCFLKSEGSVAWQRRTARGPNELDHKLIPPYIFPFFSFPSIFIGSSHHSNCVIKSFLGELSSCQYYVLVITGC